MAELDPSDLSLIFKQLVVLPKDRTVDSPKVKTESKKEIATTEYDPKAALQTSEVAEAAVDYTANNAHKFAIITLPELKTIYTQQGSKFRKIVQALKLSGAVDHIYTNWATELDLQRTEVIWTIGLSPEEEKLISSKRKEKTLHSPDIELLTTTEEKRAMFEPLKSFVAANQTVLDSLQCS